MKKIVLTGGGTAGHVTPNIALLPYLKSEGYEVYYIGSKEGMEKKSLPDTIFHTQVLAPVNLEDISTRRIFQICSKF